MMFKKLLYILSIPAALTLLPGCSGIFSGVYDEPPSEDEINHTKPGSLYIDASNWLQWHYIDLSEVTREANANPDYNPSSAWETYNIPLERVSPPEGKWGIYTYWYDVFGVGISKYEFRDYKPTVPQPEPDEWSFAVHRNNVRTNGGEVASTGLHSMDELPEDAAYYESLNYSHDEWNETDVWVTQDQMLLGYIGNQGIEVNPVLSSWLKVSLPPIPPSFELNNEIFILKLKDSTYAALQLENYVNPLGTKCCLTIRYRYPLLKNPE